jgi:hypothetical protein
MAQEFTIKSELIEDKINQLLPSQAGLGAGIDFSASTMVIPIVDLTETAEGSALRLDLQKAFTHTNVTFQETSNTTDTPITTTGYWLAEIQCATTGDNANVMRSQVIVNDGTTDKVVFNYSFPNTTGNGSIQKTMIIKVSAGESIKTKTNQPGAFISVNFRQIADLAGNLINP